MAEAVVELARLGLRQHLVRLRHLTEPLLGVGRVVDVGMELARELAEGALDVGVRGVARDPEELVVVVLRRRHAQSVAARSGGSGLAVDALDEAGQLLRRAADAA